MTPFLNNPIEILRQERLKRERMRQQKVQKEKDKLKVLDHEDISCIDLVDHVHLNTESNKKSSSRRSYNFKAQAELDYSGANIKMRICKDIEYIPNWPILREDIKETLEFIDVLNDF